MTCLPEVIRPSQRRGVAAVEFALTAPLLVLFLFGFFEVGRALLIDSVVENAAYEGARRGIVPGATRKAVVQAAERIGKASSLRSFMVEIEPSVIDAGTKQIAVTVTAPTEQNGIFLGNFLGKSSIKRTVTMTSEPYLRFLFRPAATPDEPVAPRPRGRGKKSR